MVGDLDDHKISSSMQNFSSVQNFRYLGGLEASNSLTGREGGTFCVLSRVGSQLKTRGEKYSADLPFIHGWSD